MVLVEAGLVIGWEEWFYGILFLSSLFNVLFKHLS